MMRAVELFSVLDDLAEEGLGASSGFCSQVGNCSFLGRRSKKALT